MEWNYLKEMSPLYIKVIILLIGVGLFSCKKDRSALDEYYSNLTADIERAETVHILYSDSAIVRVEIEAPIMLTSLNESNPYQEFPEGVIVTFYDDYKRVSGHLSAQYAIRENRKNTVIVRDSVVWTTIGKEKLETEELIWDERNARISTDKFVVITRPEEIIYGHGFEAEQDFSDATIHVVEGRIKVKQ